MASTGAILIGAAVASIAAMRSEQAASAPAPRPLYHPPPPASFPLHAHYTPPESQRLFLVGDIHGCIDELKLLVAEAGLTDADRIISVGDMPAKGPASAEVIRYLRERDALSVCGNHEQFVLAGSLLLEDDRPFAGAWSESNRHEQDPSSERYAREYYARLPGFHDPIRGRQHHVIAGQLTAEELDWLHSLPLSLTLHGSCSGYMIVHAALVPTVPLTDQHPTNVMSARNILPDGRAIKNLHGGRSWAAMVDDEEQDGASAVARASDDAPPSAAAAAQPSPSASAASPSSPAAASSPPCVVFGHDSSRGFQRPHPLRLGLDTGCVTGGYLTGLLLPEGRLFHVRAAQAHKPPKDGAVCVPPPMPSGVLLADVPCVPPALPGVHADPRKKQQQLPCSIL